MKKSPKLRVILGTLTIVIIVIFLAIAVPIIFRHKGIDLKVANNSDRPIKNVRVVITGSNILLGEIKPKENKKLEIKARGDSDVKIEYNNFENNKFRCLLDTYIMTSSSGTMDIYIEKPGDVSYKFVDELIYEGAIVSQEKAICDCKKAKKRK